MTGWLRRKKAASDTSPWDARGVDLLARIDRGLRLSAPRGRRPLPRPEDERCPGRCHDMHDCATRRAAK